VAEQQDKTDQVEYPHELAGNCQELYPAINTRHTLLIGCICFTCKNSILKYFVSRDVAALVQAFTVYVRPILEFASSDWSPYQIGKIEQVESVQRRFTKIGYQVTHGLNIKRDCCASALIVSK